MYPLIETTKQQSRREQHDMQSKCAIVIVRKAGKRALRMKPLHQAVDETSPVIVPFVQWHAEKIERGQLGATRLSARKVRGSRIEPLGDGI